MIPEFITAKPSPNRSASETPPGAGEHSADQLLNKDAFQKALQEQTSESQAEPQSSRTGDRQQVSAADETRPEPTSRLATERTSTDTDRSNARQEASKAAANQSPASGNDAAESSATYVALTDDASGTNQDSPGGAKEPQSRESSKLIRRIDPANYLTSGNTASPPANEQVGNELASQTPDTALPRLVSPDNLDSVILPSLIRLPLDNESISQLPGDLVPENTSAVNGDLRELPAGLVPSVVDDELRPFLNDALVPAAEPNGTNSRLTTTDPFLIGDASQRSPSANVNASIANEDLLSIPTLPSLRPDAATSQTSINADSLTSSVVGKLVNEEPSSVVATVDENSSPISVRDESESQLPADEVPPGTERESEDLALVLPSLTSGPKRARESSRVAEGLAFNGKQPDARNDSLVVQGVSAGIDVPNDSETETKPGVLRGVVGNASRSSVSAIVTAESDVDHSVGPLPDPADVETSELTQSADVEVVPATVAHSEDETAPIRNEAGEVTTNPTLKRTQSSTVRAIEPGDRQSRPVSEAANVSTNAVVVEPVQLGSPADIEPDRLGVRNSEGRRQGLPEDGNDVPPNQQATRQREKARTQSNQERPPVTQVGPVPNLAEASAKVGGERPSSDGSAPRSSDQVRVSERDRRLSPTDVESSSVETKATNAAEVTSVASSATSPTVQNRQPVSSVSNQQGPVTDTSADVAVASAAPIHEVSDVSASRVPIEVPSIDASTVSSIQSPNASATSAAPARSDVVREPAVPMEIQEAVSAIQEATSGDSHIRVRLNPRELGTMLVDVSRTESGVVARLEVESAAARVAVLETLPDLQQSLARSGAAVDRVEVVLMETRADSGRQEGDQSQQRDQQQARQDRQSSDQRQARDEQNQRREQNERREQRESLETPSDGATDFETPEQLDVKL